MSIEKGTQREPRHEEPKITLQQFEQAAKEYLDGTNILLALSGIKLETHEDGCLKEHVVRNIKTMLRKAEEMTPDEVAKEKFGKMLDFMEGLNRIN